jgi:membrane protein implicated in regulation of membrane protease activity
VWTGASLSALGLAATIIISAVLAAVVWIPLLFLLGGVMLTIWAARRRRQVWEGRDSRDIKNPREAELPWPSDAIDDRLPEP